MRNGQMKVLSDYFIKNFMTTAVYQAILGAPDMVDPNIFVIQYSSSLNLK